MFWFSFFAMTFERRPPEGLGGGIGVNANKKPRRKFEVNPKVWTKI